VDRLVELVLGSLRRRFAASEADLLQQNGTLRRRPQAAAWCAGLFWAALERLTLYEGAGSIWQFAPQQAKVVGSLIGVLEASTSPAAREWAKAVVHEAGQLRMVQPYVKVVDTRGVEKRYSWTFYDGTPWLARMPSLPDEKGDLAVRMDMTHDEAGPLLGGRSPSRLEATLAPHSRTASRSSTSPACGRPTSGGSTASSIRST
jgi:hypothetical protein